MLESEDIGLVLTTKANDYCVLCRLNKVAHTDVDPDQFEYEKEYVTQKRTEGIEGEWSGFAIYAKAKQNMVIKSGK